MKHKKRKLNMFIPTIVMGAIAITLLAMGYFKGKGEHITGLKAAFFMTIEILPLLLFAFIVAGMIQVFIPKEQLAKWVGTESGIKGILLGTIAGGFTPGGPYVSLPIMAVFLRAGASTGVMVAYLTSWSLWAIARLPMEVGILGWKFTIARLVSTFFFPPIAGIIAQILFPNFK